MKRLFVIAAIATLATAAQAEEASKNTAAASTTTATAPAATTVAASDVTSSTTLPTAAAAAAPTKSWSVTLMNQTTGAATDFNYAGNDKKSFESVNYVGFGYKLSPKSKIGIRHNFQQKYDGAAEKNAVTNLDPSVTYSLSGVAGILKSDELAPAFQYYIPTTDGSRKVNSYGKMRADLVPNWTITPKWSFAYVLSPRQDFVPVGEVTNSKGELKKVFSKTTIIQNPNLTYTINDRMDAYTGITFIHILRTQEATLDYQEVDLGAGMNFSLLGGKIVLNPEVTLAQTQVEGGIKSAQEDPFQEKNLSYTLTSVIAF